ncbi:hypothetical protein BH20VER1_BH20VER1_16130 [soil metagenome]
MDRMGLEPEHFSILSMLFILSDFLFLRKSP